MLRTLTLLQCLWVRSGDFETTTTTTTRPSAATMQMATKYVFRGPDDLWAPSPGSTSVPVDPRRRRRIGCNDLLAGRNVRKRPGRRYHGVSVLRPTWSRQNAVENTTAAGEEDCLRFQPPASVLGGVFDERFFRSLCETCTLSACNSVVDVKFTRAGQKSCASVCRQQDRLVAPAPPTAARMTHAYCTKNGLQLATCVCAFKVTAKETGLFAFFHFTPDAAGRVAVTYFESGLPLRPRFRSTATAVTATVVTATATDRGDRDRAPGRTTAARPPVNVTIRVSCGG